MYYLQSRYYDASVSRFLNPDSSDYLGLAGTVVSYNIIVYCENDGVNYVDDFGHAPSLRTLTIMHNAVVKSAQVFLLTVGIITMAEVWTCHGPGRPDGRMDIYSYTNNQVWEVKPHNSGGVNAGVRQLLQYTTSYVYSLYHTLFRIRQTPKHGKRKVYGATVVLNYLVLYRPYPNISALILYDYMTIDEAANILYNAAVAADDWFEFKLEKLEKRTRGQVARILTQIRRLIDPVKHTTKRVISAIGSFLKTAGPVILMFVAIIIFLFTGVPLPI